MWTLEEKQQYLRNHLEQDQFEEFFEYLEGEVKGNIDIENWSDEFIKQIVEKFKNKKEEDSKNLQTSFYQYQANQPLQAVTAMVLEEIQKPKPVLQPKKPKPQKKVQIVENIHVNPPIAFIELDSIFNKEKKKEAAVLDVPNPQNFKTFTPGMQLQTPTINVNNFATNQFWDFGSKGTTKGHKTTTNNVSKSSTDFASFDFWSQPSGSPQHTKTLDFDVFSDKVVKNEGITKKKDVPTYSYDDLVKKLDENIEKDDKKVEPSPYQKKKNIGEVIIGIEDEKKAKSVNQKRSKDSKSIEREKSAKKKKKTAKVIYDGEIILKNQYENTVKCFPSVQRTKLKDPNLRATIESHEIVQRTFLMPDYTMYLVKIHPLNITCKRNYEDFQRLRKTLSKLFPATKLAYLESNSWFSATNLEFIKNQKQMLEFFLNDLIQNTEIRNSKIFEDFLTLTDHKQIKRKFQQWDKLEAPRSIEQLCLLGGKVQINLSQQQRLYHQNFNKYESKMVQFLDKQMRLTAQLSQQYKQIEQTQTKLIDLVKQMMQQTAYFNDRVYDLQFERINEALKVIHESYLQQSKITKFKHGLISSLILPFLKYEKENLAEIQQLVVKQQQFFRVYLKRSIYEKVDESMPYTSDKLKQFKNGVLEESKNFQVLKQQAGFMSNQLCQEANRVIETLGRKYLDLWRKCAEKQRDQYERMHQFWDRKSMKTTDINT